VWRNAFVSSWTSVEGRLLIDPSPGRVAHGTEREKKLPALYPLVVAETIVNFCRFVAEVRSILGVSDPFVVGFALFGADGLALPAWYSPGAGRSSV
jgi:hypothetical protein